MSRQARPERSDPSYEHMNKYSYKYTAIRQSVSPVPRASVKRGGDAEDFLVVGLVAGIVEHLAVPDDALPVEHKHRALRDALQPDHVLVEDAVVADDLLVEIAEQREVQTLVGLKRLEREKRVDADAVDPCTGGVQLAQRIAKRAELLSTYRTERRWEERQNHR